MFDNKSTLKAGEAMRKTIVATLRYFDTFLPVYTLWLGKEKMPIEGLFNNCSTQQQQYRTLVGPLVDSSKTAKEQNHIYN